MLPAVSAVRAAVPSLRTTSPNPINAVLLPEAAQVNRHLPTPTRSDITQFNLLSGMWRVERWIYHTTDGHRRRKKEKKKKEVPVLCTQEGPVM